MKRRKEHLSFGYIATIVLVCWLILCGLGFLVAITLLD